MEPPDSAASHGSLQTSCGNARCSPHWHGSHPTQQRKVHLYFIVEIKRSAMTLWEAAEATCEVVRVVLPWESYRHVEDLLLVVEGMALSKQGQFGPGPAVDLSPEHQLLLPQLQTHPEVIHVGFGLLCHLQ